LDTAISTLKNTFMHQRLSGSSLCCSQVGPRARLCSICTYINLCWIPLCWQILCTITTLLIEMEDLLVSMYIARCVTELNVEIRNGWAIVYSL